MKTSLRLAFLVATTAFVSMFAVAPQAAAHDDECSGPRCRQVAAVSSYYYCATLTNDGCESGFAPRAGEAIDVYVERGHAKWRLSATAFTDLNGEAMFRGLKPGKTYRVCPRNTYIQFFPTMNSAPSADPTVRYVLNPDSSYGGACYEVVATCGHAYDSFLFLGFPRE